MSHHCHAHNCPANVPPKLLMCRKHWHMVPRSLQKKVWDTYRPGQEIDKRPTTEYLKAADEAVRAVAKKEGYGEIETGYSNILDQLGLSEPKQMSLFGS